MTARMVMAMMSQRLCSRICWRRGAGTWAKHWRIETGFVLAMILLLREPCRTEKNHSCVHLSKSRPAPKIHRQESGAIALAPGAEQRAAYRERRGISISETKCDLGAGGISEGDGPGTKPSWSTASRLLCPSCRWSGQ